MRSVAAIATAVPLVSAYDNGAPHSRMPALGWSSWVSLGPNWPGPKAAHPIFDFCDEGAIKASVDAYISVGLYDAGYRHFHLDDCWAAGRNSTGHVFPEQDHFPNGMKSVVDYVHSKGLTFGLYTCGGEHTCVGKAWGDGTGVKPRPGSQDHWQQDADVYAEWGVDWVKMDWCGGKGHPADVYPLMSAALNKTGRHIHFNMCEWGVDKPWEWAPKIAQSWRCTGDHTPVWDSTKSIIKQRTAIPAEQGGMPYAWNDMDMLETGNYAQAAHANGKQGTMTATEYKTEFTMWAILASPLTVTTPLLNCTTGTCVAQITDLQKEILLNTEVIATNQDVTPAGRLVQDGSSTTALVYARNLTGGDVAVALYNPADSKVTASFDFSILGWPKGTTVSARDLWAHKDLGSFTDKYGPVSVEEHASVALRLHPTKGV